VQAVAEFAAFGILEEFTVIKAGFIAVDIKKVHML